MRRLGWLGFGTILGAALMWTAMSYHLLRTRDGIAWVPKSRAGLASTYLDVRRWGVTEWTEHPELVLTLERNQRTEIIGDAQVLGATLRDAANFVR